MIFSSEFSGTDRKQTPGLQHLTGMKRERMDLPEAVNNCPHFLKEMQACNLHSDGIYLPSRAYLIFYCLNEEFRKCATFRRYNLLGKFRMSKLEAIAAGRRRYFRVPEQWHILIRTRDPSGIFQKDFAIPAIAYDISQGGMRIVTKGEIPTDGWLHFVFGQLYPAGTGSWKELSRRLKPGSLLINGAGNFLLLM